MPKKVASFAETREKISGANASRGSFANTVYKVKNGIDSYAQSQAQQYINAYDKYLSGLDAKATNAKQQYDNAVKTNKLANTMTFDPAYSGYATDELAASLLNTNKNYGKSVSNDELAKLYKNWQDADAEARQVRSEGDYWKAMQKFGSSDAAIADFNKQIQAIKDNPEPWTNVSKSDPNKVKIEDLEKQRDAFIATDTRYKNAADDYAAIMAWQKGNAGTVGNYKQAQAAYNKAQAELDALQSMMPKHTGQTDTSGMNEQIAAAVRKRDRAKTVMDYAYDHRYEDLKNAEDFDIAADKGEIAFKEYLESPEYHNQIMGGGGSKIGGLPAYADMEAWTEDEKKTFFYLFIPNRDAAFQYANEVLQHHEKEDADKRDLSTEEFAQRNFGTGFLSSAGSIPANIIGGLYDYAAMGAEYQYRGGIYESQYHGASRWGDNVRGTIANKLNSEHKTVDIPLLGEKGLGDVYQLFMSMADSSVSAMAGGGAANIMFFGSAAASATRDALERGLSDRKALAIGFASGVNEVIGETFSIEHLLKQGDIADFIRKGLLPMMLQQGAVEGSEELLTSFLNNLADKLISGDDSKFMQEVYVKMGNGMSYTDAVKEARMDQIRDYCTDVAGGFLSGSLMSGGKAGIETARAASTTYKGDVRGLLDVSKLTGEDSNTRKLAAKYQERYEKKGSISNLQAAKLEVNAMDELQTKDRSALTTQVKQRLEALDVQNADKAAKAIVDRLLGEQKGAVGKLSDASIFKDSRVRIAYQEALEQLGGRNTTASWLDDSGLMTLGKDPAVGRTMENRLKLVKLKGSDERVEIKKAGMQGDNLTLTYEQDGEDKTVTTDELELDDYQREALQALVDILGDDAAYAFNGMRNAQRQLFTLQGISNYATEFAAIRDIYGRNGTNIETALKSPMRNLLSDGQVMQAYNRGKELGPVKTGDGSEVARGTGDISLEGGLLDGHMMGAVKDQEAVRNSEQFKLLQRLAKRFGWDMVIYESEAVDEEGNLGYAPRGAYVQDGKIWLDWNAGVNNITKSTDFTRWMIFLTMSHEITHFLEENAKKEYAELRKFIERHMAEHMGYTFADAMNRKMAGRIDAINRGEVDRNGKPLKPMSAEEAAREVIADACETMLVRSEYIGKMVEESPSLFMQLRKAIRAFFDTILGKDADGYNSSLRLSEETEAIQDVADEVSRLWDAALKAAVENRLSEEARDEIPSTDEQQAAGISTANEIINEARRRVLQDAKNPTAAAQQNKVDRIMRQLATVNRETPVPRRALPSHQEQQTQQETPVPAPKLTAKEKAAIKNRFNDAVDKLMTSYLFDGIDLSREDAERMVTEYAALHDGYYSLLDEAKQKGELKTQKQYARDFYETLEADEAEAFDNLEAESQELVARMGVGTTIEANEDGEMEIAVSEDRNTIAFSPRTYQDSGKAKLIAALKENGHTQEEIDAVTDVIEATGDFLEKLADQFANSHGYLNLKNNLWATVSTNVKTGKQVISTLVNNGDYPVNLDLQLICKKRVAYMRMLTRLIDDGVFEKVDFKGGAIADLNKVLRDGGFETACLGCFVEARRLQLQAWAETIVEEWNAAVDKRNPQAGSFNFAQGGNTLNQMEIAGLITELENAGKKNDKGNLNLGVGAVADKMGRLLDRVPSLQQHLTVADLLTPQGMSTLRKYDQNLFSLVKQRYGANSPKIVQDFNAYNSEIADLSFKFVKEMIGESVKGSGKYTRQAKKVLKREAGESKEAYNRRVETYAMRKYLYDIGGARIQSFSDFMIENVFDYMQIIADLSAREFPLHGYSKEAVFLRLFGMTGGKFNGSLIAHVDGSMGKEYAGLLPASEASNGRGIVVDVDGKKYAICFDDYARHVATGSFIQSIGMKDIVALQLDPRYSKNVGSITIGVSDKQILAMLDSSYFRMVIPYHSSGMLPEFARLVGVNFYNDYQDYQSTKVAKCFDRDGNPVEGFWQANGKSISIDTHFDFNEAVQRLGDAKAAADEYLEWCKQRHPVYDGKKLVGYATFTAKFSDSPYGTDFTTHPNYYKLLEDFNVYDSIGESSALQGAVTMTFPSEATRLTAEQMTAYKQALRDTGLYTEKEINKYAAKADMTFQEIIAEEIGNRAEYESKQAKVWDATVDKAETMLLEKYGREGSKVQLSARDFSYRTQMDRDYMAAVERGDMETAQRMVDEAAAAAGYNRRAFHGTVSKFWTFRRGKEGIHFGTLEVAQQTLEKDRSRHEFSSYPLGTIRANLDRFNAEQLWNLSEELENLKWRGYSDIPSLDPKTVYDNAEAVRGYMDKILELHPEARSDTKIDMKDMFDEHEDRIIDAYIKMQHPMTVPVDIGDWSTFGIANALLHKLNGTTDSFYKYNREEKTGDWKDWNPDDIKGIELTESDRPALESLAGHYKEYEELVDFLHSKGVDSIEYTNMYEGSEDNISYLLLDPEQVKLSDPVTYDDAGNVIPLSERFNSGTGDIRYSARTDAKSDRELLLDASEAGMTDAEKRAAADYKAKVDVFRQRQQAVTTALDALDKAVQAGNVAEANKLRTKLTAAEKKMSEALAALTEAERGPELREILRREREIQRQRTTKRIRDSYTRRELRQRVDRLWKDLNRRITSPTETKRIPIELMQQAIDVLQAINMDTTKEGSQGGQKLRNKLLELRARYTELQNDQDFRRAAVYDAQVAQYLDNMIEVVGDTPINRMSNEQLAAVFNVLQALDHTARNAVKIKLKGQEIEAYEVSKHMTAETRSFGKKKTGAIETWINAQLSPARMFNRFGGYTKNSYWSRVYDMLNEGQLKQTQLMMEGSLIFEDLLSGKDYEKFVDPKNTVDVGLKDENGNNIVITHGMMVALYMHLQNEQNRRHVAYGGLTIPALKDYYSGKKVKGSENAVRVGGVLQEMADLNDRIRKEEDAGVLADLESQRDMLSVQAADMIGNLQATIETKLTDYDRQWIAASRELFDGFSKRVLNQTTLEIYGIKRANVENYMPIWVDGDFLNTPFESVAKDMSLENAGFMKERVDSSKPIRLADISDVTASQIRKVSQYCGLMPVIRAFNKVWGKTQTGYRDSLQKAVHETFGQAGVKYIENLMADLNGARGTEDSALGEFLNRMRGHMAQASLTLSLRTALGQIASYPTAAAVLGWDAIGKGITDYKKVDPKLIQKWSPLLYYRMKGYRDPELGNIAEMNSKWDRLWKKARWATGWIQAMDGFTVGQLVWSASEAYVQIHNKNLVKGTDAYYEAVAKKFNEAVELTQPNYTTMQRPDILRNPNALVKQLTMFLTQRLQNFNIVYDAAATYSKYRSDFKAKKNGVTAEDVRQAGIQTRTAVLSQVAAAATITAFKFLADVLLHAMNNYRDDDKELTKESISIELLDMFIDSLAGNVLGGGEVYDVIESKAFGKTYYGIEVTGVSTVTDLINTANTVFDHVAQGKASVKDLDLLAKRLGPVAGIPYANAMKIINGGRYWVEDAINGELFEAGVDRTTAQQAHRLYRAYVAMDYGQVNKIRAEVNDDNAVNKALTEYIKKQFADGKINRYDAQRQLVKYVGKDAEAAEKMIREYSAEVETGIKFSQIEEQFLLGDIDAAKAKQMLTKYGGLDAATAQMKVDFWSYQNKHAGSTLEFSSYKTYVNKYKSIGLTVEQYEDYSERLRNCKGVDANGDGKTDSGSKKKEVVALIASMNLTAAQKDQLYFANNYGASGLKDTPWHK